MPAEARFSIAVDTRGIQSSGIGRYLREMLRAIVREPRFGSIVLLGDPPALEPFTEGEAGRVRTVRHEGGFYSLRSQGSWLAMNGRGPAASDVAFFPHYDAPYFGLPPRSVVTIQDLTHFRVPELFPGWKRAVAGRVFDRVVSRAARVLVTSASTRTDLLERVPVVAPKVETIPLGVGPAFAPLSADERAGAREAGPAGGAPFLLCVGNRPHKNVRSAVEALAILRRARPDLRLVVVGAAFPRWADVLALAESLGVRDAIVEREEATDRELRNLYSTCEAFLFPSLYEGFGLPVLEAMACGAPVVASDRASLPEVVGDAGLLVDPLDPGAIAAAVERVLESGELRRRLVARGLERAARFSWDLTGERTVRVLLEVAAGRAARAEPIAAAGRAG